MRYLLGIDDNGMVFVPSPDPMLGELQEQMAGIMLGDTVTQERLKLILSRVDLFGLDLVKHGLSGKITMYFNELNAGVGAVRKTLKRALEQEGSL